MSFCCGVLLGWGFSLGFFMCGFLFDWFVFLGGLFFSFLKCQFWVLNLKVPQNNFYLPQRVQSCKYFVSLKENFSLRTKIAVCVA